MSRGIWNRLSTAAARGRAAQRPLLTVFAAGEGLTGLARFLAPGPSSALLFGRPPGPVAPMITRLAGIALAALGTAARGASPGGASGALPQGSSGAPAGQQPVLDRTQLPIPHPRCMGTINRTLEGSMPDWGLAALVKATAGAPNLVLVLIDDAGFGNPITFGGPTNTPNFTRVGQAGLLRNHFHVVALCSPTRAALLSGRNHHSVGFGSIAEFSGPFPGCSTSRPQSCAPLPRILQLNGYSTARFGKGHIRGRALGHGAVTK